MYKLSTKATEDIEHIIDYTVVNFGSSIAIEYHKSLKSCFDILSNNPSIGVNYDHIRKDYLCYYHRSHAIFFKKNKHNILIIRVLHSSMDAPKHMA